ncbi:MAG: M56 family metallopeptidase [Oscillospiraceae bacterium]|nr:M56 family metallopeptidase [Oscillospiraceae bacterium]
MTTLFQNVLTASFHGSVVILAVLLLRLALKKTPKKFLCLLWLLAGIRLLMPFEIKSDFSLQPEPRPVAEIRQQMEEILFFEEPASPQKESSSASRSPARNQYTHTPAVSENPELPEEVETVYTPSAITEEVRTETDYMAIAAWVWLAVASLFLVYTVFSYTRLKLLVREAVKIPGGWECDHIETAFILGFIRPKIYIPMGLSQVVRKHILAHERTHLEKGDHWFKMIGFIALALHWFNPLVWVAYILLCKDIEMACDERVVQFMDLQERKEYSAALLNCSTSKAHFAACPVAFGEVSVKERITSVLKYKKPGFWISLAGIIAIVFVAVCLVTSPEAQAPAAETAAATEPSAPMTAEEKEQLAQSREEALLQQVKDGLEDMFSRETAALEFYSSYEGGGSVPWQCAYFTHDGNKMWSIHDYRDGRIEKEYLILDGIHYDYVDQLWVAASAGAYADPLAEFREWFNFDQYDDLYGFSESDIQTIDSNYSYRQIKFIGLKEYDGIRYTFSFSTDGQFTGATITGLDTGYGEVIHVTPSSFYTEKDIIQRFEDAKKYTVSEEEYGENKIPSNTTDYDRDFMLGSGQMRWYYFDKSWQFACGAENATATGLTMFYCESDEGQQSLTADDGFWLEQLVDGKWQLLEPAAEVTNAPAEKIHVSWTTRDTVKISWADSYGTLNHGFYRLGRYHTLVMPDGRTETIHAYAKFRVYNPNQDVLLNQCRNAVQNLLNAQHYHLYTFDWMSEHDYEYYHSSEVWKHGKDYLEVDRYPLRSDLSQMSNVLGSMWRDGNYYSLSWEDEPATSPVSEWSGCVEGYMDDSNFSMWSWSFEWYDAQVEEVYQEGNTIHIIETYDFNDLYENTEIILTLDDSGNLKGMVKAYLPTRNCADKDKVIEEELVVFDTAANAIGTLISSQDIDTPMPFSWEDDRHFYPDMQTTGFKNTSAKAIKTCTDAVARADQESTMPPLMEFESGYCQYRTFRDDSAGMWKVELFWWQHDTRQIIYLNDQGITQGIISEE